MTQNQQEMAENEEKAPRYRWVMVGLLIITQQVSTMVIGGLGILLPAIRKDLGFSVGQSGLLGSVINLPQAILFIPASLVLVRYRPKWVYLIAYISAAIVSFFVGRAATFILLAITYSLLGTMVMMKQIPDTLLRLQWVPRREFATVMGITMAMMALSQSASMMLIPFLLIVISSWRNIFSAYSLAVLLLAIVWLFFARERITPDYQEGMSSSAGRSPLKGVLKRKEFPMIGIAILGNALAYSTTLLFLPTYLLEERGIPLTTVGFIVGLLPIGGVCANLTMGFISDRIGLRKPTIWPPGVIQPLLYFVMLSPIPVWALPALTLLVGFAAWSPFSAIRSIPFELPGIKPSEIAVGQSMISAITILGMVLGAPAVGYLAQGLGSLKTALIIICLFPLTMAIAGFLLPETGRKGRLR